MRMRPSVCVWGPQATGEVATKGQCSEGGAPGPPPPRAQGEGTASPRHLQGNIRRHRRTITHSFIFTKWQGNGLALSLPTHGASPGTEAQTDLACLSAGWWGRIREMASIWSDQGRLPGGGDQDSPEPCPLQQGTQAVGRDRALGLTEGDRNEGSPHVSGQCCLLELREAARRPCLLSEGRRGKAPASALREVTIFTGS